jgi:hypothetical protein
MMDDYSLAESVKNGGFRLFVAEGIDVMRVRLYTNLREIWAGALKTSVQITGGWSRSVIGMIFNFLVNVVPVLALIGTVLAHDWPAAIVMAITVVLQMIYYSSIRVMAFRLPPWSGITYPIGGIIITAILADGMIRLATGRNITWKGRSLLGRPELPVRRS